jgi:hypothetical protein
VTTQQTSEQGAVGVAFPDVAGSRSTTATGRAVFADAARVLDPGLAEEIEAEGDWRRRYLVHARRLLEAELRASAEEAAVPAAGLASLHRRFVFVRGGDSVPLPAALESGTASPFEPVTLEGAAGDAGPLGVPYKGELLSGDALHRQLDRWLEAGTVEPSLAEALRLVVANPHWLYCSDLRVVGRGPGAEMGPLQALCRWGANVVPIDLPRLDIWLRILAMIRQGRGRATIPVRERPAGLDEDALAGVAGADLVTELPEVAAWLDGFDGPLTLGNYVYADGAAHVRVSLAVDALIARLAERRDDLSLGVLATPTDVFAVPEPAVDAARRRFAERRRLLERGAHAATRGRLFAPNYPELVETPSGVRVGVADCLVPQQGPNYALAKRLQGWRASVARARGLVTSINVAPPTRTRSVLKNRVLAAAYAGARRFGVEVFDPATSNTLMAALLVHDLRNPAAAANPQRRLEHPAQLFMEGANHGGLWRNPFAPRSALGFAVALGLLRRRRTRR